MPPSKIENPCCVAVLLTHEVTTLVRVQREGLAIPQTQIVRLLELDLTNIGYIYIKYNDIYTYTYTTYKK
jgi:hypothetical protein